MVCNGPFCLQAWEPGSLIRLTRNPYYRGRWRGNVEAVELSLQVPGDWRTAFDMYDAHQVDVLFLGDYPPQVRPRMRQRHADEFLAGPGGSTFYLIVDSSRPPFDDVRVRQAFVHAMDRTALARPAEGGGMFPATGGLVPPGIPGHVAGVALPHDPGRGRALLAAAGYAAGRGLPDITVLGFAGSQAFLEVLNGQWRESLGVTIQCSVITEFADYHETVQNDPPNIHLQGWIADYPDPDGVFRGLPGLRGHHVQVDELLGRARMARDQPARLKLYRRAENMLVTEARLVPTLYNQESLLVKPWVRGLNPSPGGSSCLKDVTIEPHGMGERRTLNAE
jgi:oligopeptide transport system substrate-binding protein